MNIGTVRFAQFRPALLALKPLFFQVPQQEDRDPLVWTRSWIYRQLASAILTERQDQSSHRGVVISGLSGSGKTAVALQLVDHSCFGRARKIPPASRQDATDSPLYDHPHNQRNGSEEGLRALASRLVAYHFCQVIAQKSCRNLQQIPPG